MAKRHYATGFIGGAVVLGGLAWLLPAIGCFFCAKTPVTNDPPIIIHGGSLHLSTLADSSTPNGPISIPVTSVLGNSFSTPYVDSSGNRPGSPSNPGTLPLSVNWQIKVCDAVDEKRHCRANGFSLCSSEGGASCSAGSPIESGALTITITSLGASTGDVIVPSDEPPQYAREQRYRLTDSGGSSDAYHPKYIEVFQKSDGTSTTYSCGIDPSKTKDWGKCWIALGNIQH